MPAPKKKITKKAAKKSLSKPAKKSAKKSKAAQFNNPAGCSQCSCTMYQQDYAQICTCGHSSRYHTGN